MNDSIISGITGTIITYELVLIQFKTNDEISDYNPCHRFDDARGAIKKIIFFVFVSAMRRRLCFKSGNNFVLHANRKGQTFPNHLNARNVSSNKFAHSNCTR